MMPRWVSSMIVTGLVFGCSDTPARRDRPVPATPAVLRTADSARASLIAVLVARGESAYAAGEIDTARAVWTVALAESRAVGDAPREARILTSLAWLHIGWVITPNRGPLVKVHCRSS